MTVCDEWMKRKRRGVNVRRCTTEVSEEREKREKEKERERRKEGMDVCGGRIVPVCVCVCVCVYMCVWGWGVGGSCT